MCLLQYLFSALLWTQTRCRSCSLVPVALMLRMRQRGDRKYVWISNQRSYLSRCSSFIECRVGSSVCQSKIKAGSYFACAPARAAAIERQTRISSRTKRDCFKRHAILEHSSNYYLLLFEICSSGRAGAKSMARPRLSTGLNAAAFIDLWWGDFHFLLLL